MGQVDDGQTWCNSIENPLEHAYKFVLQSKIGCQGDDWHGPIIGQRDLSVKLKIPLTQETFQRTRGLFRRDGPWKCEDERGSLTGSGFDFNLPLQPVGHKVMHNGQTQSSPAEGLSGCEIRLKYLFDIFL